MYSLCTGQCAPFGREVDTSRRGVGEMGRGELYSVRLLGGGGGGGGGRRETVTETLSPNISIFKDLIWGYMWNCSITV